MDSEPCVTIYPDDPRWEHYVMETKTTIRKVKPMDKTPYERLRAAASIARALVPTIAQYIRQEDAEELLKLEGALRTAGWDLATKKRDLTSELSARVFHT